MPQDYILRLIEQVSQMLAAIIAARQAGRNEEAEQKLAAACQANVGIPLEIVRKSSPQTLLELLEPSGGLRQVRAVMLAELLMQESAIREEKGEVSQALIARAQACALLADVLPYLPPIEQSVYREKMEMLRRRITDPIRTL